MKLKNIFLILFAHFVCQFDMYSQNETTHLNVFKTNLLAISAMTEVNISFERIGIKSRRSIEIAISYRPQENIASMSFNSFSVRPTGTRGGEYGLDHVWTPAFMSGHRSYSIFISRRFYNSKINRFYGAKLILSHRELKNGYYFSNEFFDGPGSTKSGYYWFTADHSSKRIGVLFTIGNNTNLLKHRINIEGGCSLGFNFNIDNLKLKDWGTEKMPNPDPEFEHYDKLDKPKRAEGFYITPAVNLFANLTLSKRMKG